MPPPSAKLSTFLFSLLLWGVALFESNTTYAFLGQQFTLAELQPPTQPIQLFTVQKTPQYFVRKSPVQLSQLTQFIHPTTRTVFALKMVGPNALDPALFGAHRETFLKAYAEQPLKRLGFKRLLNLDLKNGVKITSFGMGKRKIVCAVDSHQLPQGVTLPCER